MNLPDAQGLHLELAINVNAVPDLVYRYFTDPDRFRRWLGAGASIDPRVGGTFRIPYPTGPVAAGDVLALDPPHQVTLSWGYEGDVALPPGATRIVVTISATATGSLITFRQHGFVEEAARDGHVVGWRYYLSALETEVQDEAVQSTLVETVDTYLSAWAETDPDRRVSLLARCWAPDGQFRDRGTTQNGLNDLAAYIDLAQAGMPGLSLVRTGPVDYCRGSFRYPWSVQTTDGAVVATGTNFGELDTSGTIMRIVGFWDSVRQGE